jgi:uncharacterized membrane protein YfcA
LPLLVPLGLVAGLLTTLAGLGGGMMLILVLSAWWGDPVRALAVSTPALLVGNVHRAFLYRRDLPLPLAYRFAGSALAGALVGGALALTLPPWLVQASMVVSAGAAVARQFVGLPIAMPTRALPVAGAAVGLASTTGGAGLLAGPILQAAGLTAGAYLATLSLAALSMHVGRLVALGAGGAMDATVWRDAAVLMVCIPLGNQLGSLVRGRVGEGRLAGLEIATSATLVALAVGGLL